MNDQPTRAPAHRAPSGLMTVVHILDQYSDDRALNWQIARAIADALGLGGLRTFRRETAERIMSEEEPA